MEPFEIIAQAIGIFAMLFVIFSYQFKSQKSIYFFQLCGSILFSVHFFMIGATIGGLLNILAFIRAALFVFKDRLKTDRVVWLIAFILSFIAMYILNFTLFGKEVTPINLMIELLPVIGMTAISVGFRLKDSADIRRCALVASPAWLIYNVLAGSLGASICEIFSLGSIIIGMLRHDKKK